MTKPQISEVISKITKGIVPTTAIASGLLSQPSFAAPGDLDPAFGDMGRASFPLSGAAFRVQELTADESFIAGGESIFHFRGCDYYYYSCAPTVDGFMGQVSPKGSLDLKFAAALLDKTQVLDFALQPDGKVVAVGKSISARKTVFTVFRLMPGGALDPHFATAGVLNYGTDTEAHSVVLDPSGAIVVAGSNSGTLMVLRLLGSGALDGSFGKAGVYSGASNEGAGFHIVADKLEAQSEIVLGGPRTATHGQPVSIARADARMTAIGQCLERASGGSQFGNFNARSIAWKRGSSRSGSISGSVFAYCKRASRSRIPVSSHSNALAVPPH